MTSEVRLLLAPMEGVVDWVMRDTLSQTMSVPDIYLRSKVPIDMYDTLQKFAEIRKLDRASLVRDFNLYPSVENLLALERKYGDSLSLFDLTG